MFYFNFINFIDTFLSVLLILISLWCIFSPKVKDGLLMKVGLMFVIFACVGHIYGYSHNNNFQPEASDFLIQIGAVLIFAGRINKHLINSKNKRRETD